MAYALAKVTGEPLLFKGDDFTAHRRHAGPLTRKPSSTSSRTTGR